MTEDNGHVTESKSSVSLTLNAKGDCIPALKVYQDTPEDEIVRLRQLAVQEFHLLLQAVGR